MEKEATGVGLFTDFSAKSGKGEAEPKAEASQTEPG
jgi:hypothetical protein